jgi:hypothetical protein
MEQGQRPQQLSIYMKDEAYHLVNWLDIPRIKAFLEIEENGTFPSGGSIFLVVYTSYVGFVGGS